MQAPLIIGAVAALGYFLVTEDASADEYTTKRKPKKKRKRKKRPTVVELPSSDLTFAVPVVPEPSHVSQSEPPASPSTPSISPPSAPTAPASEIPDPTSSST